MLLKGRHFTAQTLEPDIQPWHKLNQRWGTDGPQYIWHYNVSLFFLIRWETLYISYGHPISFLSYTYHQILFVWLHIVRTFNVRATDTNTRSPHCPGGCE